MAEIMTHDGSTEAVVMESIESDQAESLAIGEELMAQQDELLAGKYKNASELEKAYMELQKKLGSGESTDDESDYASEEVEEVEASSNDELVDYLVSANDEYAQNGQLSEETIESLANMSSRDLIDAYFRMQDSMPVESNVVQGRELSADEVSQIQNTVGGEEAYAQLTGWAAENFSPQEIEAFDSVVESGNPGAINLALQALYYRYTDSMGYEGELIQGKPARGADAFRSQAELIQAMSDPRYDNDPAYRQDVIEKLGRSDLEF